ncbi:hypothetical protein ACFQY4_18160 [Catellatospora bangladeshensis]|uniref:Uncharacterized protein n=1 Tax=Catellatospora bangladeshensis TaxID=310355 RepID=A0A8J3NI43_9ACTN|nr:hypothetical protein [Catellatospora bangladeshensis]GIF82060.1 hypothetical protein Cba03nite_34090 [Catellatospora bangladeshensis]
MIQNDVLLSLVFQTEAEADLHGWDAPPNLIIFRQRGPVISANVVTTPEPIADAAGYLEELAWAVTAHPIVGASFVSGLGPGVVGLGVVTEAWAVSDPTALEQVRNSRLTRPISRHPQRQEVRIMSAALPGRDLCVQRIRGSEPAVFYDSADDAFGLRVEGRVPASLRALLSAVHAHSLN